MTATEILRRLLDEHGVEHKDFFDQTWWEDSDGAAYTAVETRPLYNNNPSTKLMLKRTATPEQAIAVTLGSCNCSNNCTNDCTNSERTDETCRKVYLVETCDELIESWFPFGVYLHREAAEDCAEALRREDDGILCFARVSELKVVDA